MFVLVTDLYIYKYKYTYICVCVYIYIYTHIKDPTLMHLPIYGTTSGEKREEEDGDRHLFRSNFSHTNQNIKIVVKSLCHKIRRH